MGKKMTDNLTESLTSALYKAEVGNWSNEGPVSGFCRWEIKDIKNFIRKVLLRNKSLNRK